MKVSQLNIGIGSKCAIAGCVFLALSVVSSTAAIAVDDEDFPLVQGVRFGQIPYEFENAFFSHNRDFYRNRSFTGQLKRIFGPFPENSTARDGRAVNELYLRTQFQQMNSGPILRTVDLPTPFQYSLRTLPPPVVVAPIEVIPAPIVPPVAPAPLPVQPTRPVPALW
jgi:hypothetical protein